MIPILLATTAAFSAAEGLSLLIFFISFRLEVGGCKQGAFCCLKDGFGVGEALVGGDGVLAGVELLFPLGPRPPFPLPRLPPPLPPWWL